MAPADEPGAAPSTARVARAWAASVAGTSFVSLTPAELHTHLHALTRRLHDVLRADAFDPAAARTVGADLVAAHFTGDETLGRTLDVLAEHLPQLAAQDRPEGAARRLRRTLAELATGYTAALREATIVEQESIGRAVLLARRQAESRLQVSEQRFRAMFTEAAIGIGIGDLRGSITEVNPSLSRMFGYSAEEFTRLNVSDMVHPDDAPDVWALYAELVAGRRDHFRTEKRFFRSDGTMIWTHLTVSLVRDGTGAPLYQVAMLEDVTERVRLRSSLEHLAYHDPLTGLPNRVLFAERLAAAFTTPHARRVGLCLLDLDGFKRVNDSLGHHVGDRLLVAVAERLRRCCGPDRLVARMSGDEFVVLADGGDPADLVALAEDVLTALRAPIRVDGHELRISASAGVVDLPAATTTPAELMAAADITLYRAKGSGRGRCAVFDREHTEREIARILMSSTLAAAIERGEFLVDYQPLVPLTAARPAGVEALVRWQHPTLGLLGPDRFVGLAEETGAVVPLGRWVLERACAQARAWAVELGERAPFVSVNLAPRQLEDADLVGDVAAVLARTGLAPHRLQLELTEQAVMRNEAGPLDALHALHDRGVRIAIDDFGTGYSNLSYLSRLPVDGLKLDGSFVAGLRASHAGDDELVVATLVALGHGLGLSVTAEGVETPEQLERVRALGCDLAQGWVLGRPGPAEAVPAALERAARTARGRGPAH